MRSTTIADYATLAALGAVALVLWRNWGTVSSIGSGVNAKISGALSKVNSKINDAAKE